MAVHREMRLVDVTVEVSGVMPWQRGDGDLERAAKDLDQQVREINEVLSDHGSLRHIHLSVKRVRENVCSGCGETWESMMEHGNLCCANCGEFVETEKGESDEG